MMHEILSKVFHAERPQQATEKRRGVSDENAEKIRLFDRLQCMLKEFQYHNDIVVATDTDWGLLFFHESYQKTDELNGLLSKIRDFGGNA